MRINPADSSGFFKCPTVQFLCAVGTHAMGKRGVGPLPDVLLNDVPLVIRCSDLLARGADRQHPFEGLHIIQCTFEATDI